MDKGDARDVVFTLNRLMVATGREPGVTDADTGENRYSVFSEIPSKYPENIFFSESLKNCIISYNKTPHFSRLKNEHYPYMPGTPIIYVQILSHFSHFFNGGFT
jgi:hypothetical protein